MPSIEVGPDGMSGLVAYPGPNPTLSPVASNPENK